MPQVTGAVNWETNVEKRQTTQKNPVIADNSLTRIENTHMEARMRIQVGRLQEEKQRSVADRNYEIRGVERDLAEFARLKSVLRDNQVDFVMEKWRRQRLMRAASAPRIVISHSDRTRELFAGQRKSDSNFSRAVLNDDDDATPPCLLSISPRFPRSRSAEATNKRRNNPSLRPTTALLRTTPADR
ncbi:hypothetical protein LSAT2_013360 [Lamellibrachia satsuma]|nr:hypothetical protein LSAT2_013360 [Lamellibrachia satsuma]